MVLLKPSCYENQRNQHYSTNAKNSSAKILKPSRLLPLVNAALSCLTFALHLSSPPGEAVCALNNLLPLEVVSINAGVLHLTAHCIHIFRVLKQQVRRKNKY